MKNRIASALIAAGLALGATAAQAQGLKVPGMENFSKYEPTIALTGGVVNAPAANDDATGAFGLELAMNVALLQNIDKRIRTYLQYNRVDSSGVRVNLLEFSPRFMMAVGNNISVGIGPVLSWVDAETSAGDKNLFGYGAVAGIDYRMGNWYTGLDLRYLNTAADESVTFENVMLQAKIGLRF